MITLTHFFHGIEERAHVFIPLDFKHPRDNQFLWRTGFFSYLDRVWEWVQVTCDHVASPQQTPTHPPKNPPTNHPWRKSGALMPGSPCSSPCVLPTCSSWALITFKILTCHVQIFSNPGKLKNLPAHHPPSSPPSPMPPPILSPTISLTSTPHTPNPTHSTTITNNTTHPSNHHHPPLHPPTTPKRKSGASMPDILWAPPHCLPVR